MLVLAHALSVVLAAEIATTAPFSIARPRSMLLAARRPGAERVTEALESVLVRSAVAVR
ncbi:MAG: hypothetical protein ACYDCS_09385 [Candidatus Dormibacteria bacterium]